MNENLTTLLARLKDDEREAHAPYPQYKGYTDGPEWKLIEVKRNVRTKLGRAFAKGEYALARIDVAEPRYGLDVAWCVWSVTNKCFTRLPMGYATEVVA